MALCIVPVPVYAVGNHYQSRATLSSKSGAIVKTPSLILPVQINRNRSQTKRGFSVQAAENNNNRGSGNGVDFVAGFVLGGAVFGTIAYIFAPQIRRSLLNEDESGFRRAKRPIYYDEGLERNRQTLNEKISQLNSAIDNVSSRLRGGNKLPKVPVEADAEEAAF